ncbi:hypothetical protein LRS74_10250 [Streptomyces sp. LX-29]|uniref:hypothetical protein n=1 Tax=Streptomyces sp. LX-29 TaxID=2900152 RepID=UPI00240DF387|nr:hypothetical protein [Streptomyces sp. LX-29]WFB07388.1 hypothetical protein LRS74_10250 [Streptomyces sp. LX-29]
MALQRSIKIPSNDPGLVRYRLGSSKLYLDDVQIIYEALKELERKSGCVEAVSLTAGDAIADEPDDLRDATSEELKSVRLALKDPLVSVDLWDERADVTASSNTESRAVAVAIRDFVKGKRNLRGGYALLQGAFDKCALLSAVIIAGVFLLMDIGLWVYAFPVLVGGACATFVPNAIGAYVTGTVRLIPQRRREARGLSIETRRQLIIGLSGAVIGAVIAGIAGLWSGMGAR